LKNLTQTLIIVFAALAFAFLGPAYGDILVVTLILIAGAFSGAAATGFALAGESSGLTLAPAIFFTVIALASASQTMRLPICCAAVVGILLGSASIMLACFVGEANEDEDDK